MKPKLKQLVPQSPLNQAENASTHLPLPQLCSTPSLPNDQFCVTSTAINSQSKNYTPVKREKTAATAASYTSTSYVTLHCRSQSVWAAVCCHNLFIRLQMSNFVKKQLNSRPAEQLQRQRQTRDITPSLSTSDCFLSPLPLVLPVLNWLLHSLLPLLRYRYPALACTECIFS